MQAAPRVKVAVFGVAIRPWVEFVAFGGPPHLGPARSLLLLLLLLLLVGQQPVEAGGLLQECRLFLSLGAREKPRGVESGLTVIGGGGQAPWPRKASSMVVSDAQTTCDHRSRNLRLCLKGLCLVVFVLRLCPARTEQPPGLGGQGVRRQEEGGFRGTFGGGSRSRRPPGPAAPDAPAFPAFSASRRAPAPSRRGAGAPPPA